MKIPPANFSCKEYKKNKRNFFSQKRYLQEKKMKKKEEDWQSKKKENLEKVGKIIFWFTGHFVVFLYGQIELTTPSLYH